MRRWQAFRVVCGYFSSRLLETGDRSFYPRPAWSELLEIARRHHALPALSWCLRRDDAVPLETRQQLDAVLRLNGRRNDQLCDELANIVRALNADDIEPILLKGAAHLVTGLYPTPAMRIMGDVDLLIPERRADHAVAAVKKLGFAPVDAGLEDGHHHLPPMHRADVGFAIEFHTRVMHDESHLSAPVSWFEEQTQPMTFRGLRVKVPNPTALIAHNLVHDQLNHANFEANLVQLRQLLDFALLRARHDNEIDWRELDRRFVAAGSGEVLGTYLQYDRVLLGQPKPNIATALPWRAIPRLRRAIEAPERQQQREQRRLRFQQRRQRLHAWAAKVGMIVTLPMYYVRERRRDPRGLARIFSPRTWVERSRAIRREWQKMR